MSAESNDGALLSRANQAFQDGDWSASAEAWRELARLHPTFPGPRFMLGATLHAQGQPEFALAHFLETLNIDPQFNQAHLAAASVLAELARHEEALTHCLKAIALNDKDPVARVNAGIAHEALQQPDLAETAYTETLRIDPSNINALKNVGALCLLQGRAAKALDHARAFIAAHPDRNDARIQLGEALLASHDYAEAAATFALANQYSAHEEIKPLIYGGFSEAQQQRFRQAQQLFDLAWQRNPTAVEDYRQRIFSNNGQHSGPLDAITMFLLATYDRAEVCDWKEGECLTTLWNTLLADTSPPAEFALGFRAMALGVAPDIQLQLAHRVAASIRKDQTRPTYAQGQSKRLRIGYLSPDFRNHAAGHLVSQLFAWHDRQSFEIFAYALGATSDDPIRRQIQEGCDVFRDCARLSEEQTAECIANDGIDILIDLAGYTDNARPGILALRPAPLQISWMGYLASTGADWMDYVVLDPVSAPPGDDVFYSEAIIRLPETMRFCAYAGSPTAATPSRKSAGLPETGRVLAAFHNGYKIEPQVFAIWMRVLATTPDSLLWLLDGPPALKNNLYQEAEKRGINPSRLLFAPRVPFADHIARLGLADIFLDTIRCNGGTTVCDALVAGIPVITCAGTGIAQRMAASNLLAAGFPDGVTQSPGEYENKAVEWLSQPGTLSNLKQKIKTQHTSTIFFQPKRWLLQFEQALQQVVQRKRANLPPASFSVDA